MKKCVIIASSCEPHYMNFLKVFLASFHVYNPDVFVWLDLFNAEGDYGLSAIHGNLKVREKLIPDITAAKFVTERSHQMSDALEEYDSVLWLDTDIIVRGSLNKLIAGLKPGVVRILYRPKKRSTYKFNLGVVGIGSDDETRSYWRDLVVLCNQKEDYFNSQKNAYKLWKSNLNNIKFKPLSPKYNDYKFGARSVLWHGKHNRYKHSAFQALFAHYVGILNLNVNSNDCLAKRNIDGREETCE